MERRLGELGWRFFSDETALRRYFEEVVGIDLDGDGVIGSLSVTTGVAQDGHAV